MRLQWGSDLVASYLSFADNQTLRAIDAIITTSNHRKDFKENL
jgi:hypothetical protein